jgi:hypothetical protein
LSWSSISSVARSSSSGRTPVRRASRTRSGSAFAAIASTTAGPLVDRDRPFAAGVVQLDQEDLAGAVLGHGNGLGCARVGPGGRAGLAVLGGVPVAESEVVEPGRLDLLAGDHDLVAVGPVRDRE